MSETRRSGSGMSHAFGLPAGPFHYPWEATGTNNGDVLNCCGKMPIVRKAGLRGSYNLPEQFRSVPFALKTIQVAIISR